MSVDFRPIIPDPEPTPGRGNYTDLQPFRFWCQKVLPLVYDESLSYYELLCKVVDYLNKTMEDVGVLNNDIGTLYDAFTSLTRWTEDQIEALLTAYSELQDYVNNYFDNLDVQQEINNKLDAMAADGTLTTLLSPLIPDAVASWLAAHVDPATGYVIDNTLSIAGAAADAKATGDAISDVKSDLNFVSNNFNRLETLDGEIFIDPDNWEIGGITMSSSGFTYGDNDKRIRTKQGFTYPATTGTVVKLSDYTNYGFYVGIITSDERYLYSGLRTSDYTLNYANCEIVIVVCRTSDETVLNDKYDLLPLISIVSPGPNVLNRTTVLENKTNILAKNAPINISDLFNYPDTTHNGVTFSFTDNYVSAAGTPSANAFVNLFYSTSELPFGLVAGDTIDVSYQWTSRLCLLVCFHDGTSWGSNITITNKNKTIKVPSNAVGAYFRLMVYYNNGAIVNETNKLPVVTKVLDANIYTGFIALDKYNFASETVNGITYNWNKDNTVCSVSGTAIETSFHVLFDSVNVLPDDIFGGKDINISFMTYDEHLRASILFYHGNTLLLEKITNRSTVFTVPDNADRMVVRLMVYVGYTVDNTCTVPLIIHPNYKRLFMPTSFDRRKLISFIDDDANGNEYVRKYYQACKHNGIVGAYSVITGGYADGTLDIDQLRDIQKDGFNMIVHCEDQQTYLRPRSEDYDNVEARGNYIQAILDFNELGLINPQGMWVIPYGDTENEVLTIGMDLGFDIFFSVNGSNFNRVTDFDKHKLYRCGLVPLAEVSDDTSTSGGTLARAKLRIDELMEDPSSGWLIIMTHFNTWQTEMWDSTLDSNGYEVGYSRFNEIVQYAINSGAEIVSMAEAAAYMKPFYDRNLSV